MDTRLFWLALAAFVGAVEGGLIAGQLPMISADMGVTLGQAGLLVTVHALAYAIGTPLIAVLLGGVGRRRVLAGAELGLAVCALLMAVAPFFEWMVGVRIVLAVCAGTFTGTAMATAAMLAPPGQRGRSMQVITTGRSIAILVGVPLGALVATQVDWRINYFALAAMGGAAALVLWLRLPRGMHGDTQTIRDRVKVLGNRGVVRVLLSTLLFMAGAIPVSIYITAIMSGAGIGIEYLPVVLFAGGLGAFASSLSSGRIADRIGNRRAAIGASVVVMATLSAIAALPLLPAVVRLPVLFATLSCSSYMVWAYTISVASEMAHLAPSAVPVAISLNMSGFNIATAIAATGGGWIVDTWGPSVLALAGVPLMACALVMWLLSGQGPEPPGDHAEEAALADAVHD